MGKDIDTEKRILEAARMVFIRKGYNGARMQEIADEAGINKASLHYYFRSKDRLFAEIFKQAFSSMVPVVNQILFEEGEFEEKLTTLVRHYTKLLMENPYLPQFILSETARDPEGLTRLFNEAGIKPDQFIPQFIRQFGHLVPEGTDPRHLLLNILSMSIFPFAARPLFEKMLFGGNSQAYQLFLEERREVIPQTVIRSLQPQKKHE